MVTLTELKKDTRAFLCNSCAKCSTACPLDGFAGFSPVRMVSVGPGVEEVREQAVAAQRCLTCSLCEIRCPQGVHIAEFARGLRREAIDGLREPCPHGRVFQAAAVPEWTGQIPSRDLSWIDDDLRVAETGEIALFVGCLPLFDALFEGRFGVRTTDIARSAIRALNQLDIEPVIVAEERCCGHDLLWGGDDEGFATLARANTDSFAARGVELVLTTCAECCRTWRLDYPEAVPEYQPRVQHLVEYLDERLQAGELGFRDDDTPQTVTYQDPCRLGRHLGVTDAPRRLLDAAPGVELAEMDRSGADAVCCGTAGFIHCDAASRRLQAERLGSASDTGAATLLTACPKCLIHFACAQNEDGRRNRPSPAIEVEDLTIFTTRMLAGLEASSAGTNGERTEAVT